ncbi:MAG: hypothetical protein ACI915_003600 [Gammaproteobacteria bacterium]|jgi:hypothetical protein
MVKDMQNFHCYSGVLGFKVFYPPVNWTTSGNTTSIARESAEGSMKNCWLNQTLQENNECSRFLQNFSIPTPLPIDVLRFKE